MSFSITHRDGRMEADPRGDWVNGLLSELEWVDDEHPDVAVTHETGWSVSAFPNGLVVWENVEDEGAGDRRVTVHRHIAGLLFEALSRGEVETVDKILQPRSPMFEIGLRLITADLNALTPGERAFACLDQLGDGTDLYDFYYWQVGRGAAQLPWAAKHVGAPEIAELCAKANQLFPRSVINAGSADGGTSAYIEDHDVDFTAIEEEFRRLNGADRGVRAALARFARLHPDAFPEVHDDVTLTDAD